MSKKSLQEYRDSISGMTPIATILDVGTDITYARGMARLLLSLCVTIILSTFVFSQTENTENAFLFNKYYKDVESFGRADEGSPSEKLVLSYIRTLATLKQFSVGAYPIVDSHDYHSFSSSLSIRVQGTSDRTLGLIFPFSVPEDKLGEHTYDPFFATAFCAFLIDSLKKGSLPFSIQIELLGAENGVDKGLGSRAFLSSKVDKNLSAVLFLSLVETRKTWKAIHGGEGKVSPSWFLNALVEASDVSEIEFKIPYIESQMYRLGMGPGNSIGKFLKAGIPAVQLRPDEASDRLAPSESAAALQAFLLSLFSSSEFSDRIVSPSSWDGNYLVLSESGKIVIPEQTIALVFLGALISCLSLVFIRRGARHRYAKSVMRNIPSFLIVISGTFVAFLIATAAGLLLVPESSRDPIYLDKLALFFTGKALIGLALTIGMLRVTRRWLPTQSSFYSGAAFFTSLASLIVVSVLNITFGIYFVFSTFAIGLANLTRLPWLKLAFTLLGLLAVLWPTVVALNQFPDALIDTLLIRGFFPGTFLVSAVCVPFVFMICRLLLLNPFFHGFSRRWEPVFWTSLVLVAVSVVLFALADVRRAALGFADLKISRVENPQTSKDLFVIEGAWLLPNGDFNYLGQRFSTLGQSHAEFAIGESNGSGLSYTSSVRSFLGRKTFTLTVQSAQAIKSIETWFDAENDLIVHSLNFPYLYIDTRHIKIMIGKNPPLPLILQMTIPEDSRGTLRMRTTLADSALFVPDSGPARSVPCDVVNLTNIVWN